MLEPDPSDRGHLVLFLHAHLPFVRHPAHADFLEEDWLYEAITETYIPLLAVAERWLRDDVRARITLSLSPTLLEMLRDELLIGRYVTRLCKLLDLAESEVRRNANDERFRSTAELYRDRLADTLDRYERRYSRDLVAAFKALQDAGILELVTTCATHAYLPCFDVGYAAAQIRIGAKCYRDHFGCNPRGMWLPECGYVPGIDGLLAEQGITYFFVDSHGVEYADPPAIFGTYSPIVCPSGVFAFPRDIQSSARVWSAESGYPGDGRYREFYRDIGHDLDEPSIAPLRLADGGRRNVGLKYYRVTGRDVELREKEPYDRAAALQAADEHANDFVSGRASQIEHWRSVLERPPVVGAPYDAELFGHWWFEGPEFLDLVVRKVARDQRTYRLSSPADVIDSGLDFQVAMPAASSWGAYGYSNTWLNDTNAWIWPHLHHATAELARIASEHVSAEGLERRALDQLGREVLLASASDWPFMITMGTTVQYAESRIRMHVNRANRLVQEIRAHAIDDEWLTEIELEDNIFRDIDYHDFVASGK
ncbi:MAG: glycoside hydrolase family 57 protein [Solirubrobacteraceae bacterium]